MSNYIVGLDIGSQNIKAAVAELRKDGKPYLIRVFKSPSEGIRKGTIAEVGEATRSISHVLSEVKKISKGAIKNITRCVEIAGGDVAGLIFSPLASSRSVLTKNQKELGVVLIDIGFGKTSISVYEENKLLHTAIEVL